MTDTTTTLVPEVVGVFTRDQVEILSARKGEPEWLRQQRLAAQESYATTPMPDTRPEEWRYTPIARMLELEALGFSEERAPVASTAALPGLLAARIAESGQAAGRLVQQDASVVLRELDEELLAKGVIFTSLEDAVREHPELVQKHLATASGAEAGKFAALNTAFWSGGCFLYVPKNVRVELPLRSLRGLSQGGTALFGRTLIVAEEYSEISLIDEYASEDLGSQALSLNAAEIFAAEGAQVNYYAVQRWGRGVLHLVTDRLVAGRDARITTLNLTLGSDITRADIQCRLERPGAHVDMLGLYLADGEQHLDHETLQDHIAPHASSNLLFKGALRDRGRSVFRGMIHVHEGAQRTDAYQTNRNLILGDEARADSLPNLEIAANDVRCSHAATVGQFDEEEIFYLLSRGIPQVEAERLVIFGFFAEVLDQLPEALEEVKKELARAIEQKLYTRRG
jgi:Fe-S cluster assembly protein SufD